MKQADLDRLAALENPEKLAPGSREAGPGDICDIDDDDDDDIVPGRL